jgi:hypothetical protein
MADVTGKEVSRCVTDGDEEDSEHVLVRYHESGAVFDGHARVEHLEVHAPY